MSTRGIIAVEDPDKTCRAIYVHFDMYLDGAGICLTQHYTTPERVEKLLALGGLSALGDKLSNDDPEPEAQDVCIAYHRDYGESYKAPCVWETADKLLEQELERLTMTEQVPLQDIVILGGHSLEHTSIGANPDVGRFHIVNRTAKIGAMEIAYFTYMKYKGCESKVVILLEVDDEDERWANKNGIYTAMSRAVHQLIMIRK